MSESDEVEVEESFGELESPESKESYLVSLGYQKDGAKTIVERGFFEKITLAAWALDGAEKAEEMILLLTGEGTTFSNVKEAHDWVSTFADFSISPEIIGDGIEAFGLPVLIQLGRLGYDDWLNSGLVAAKAGLEAGFEPEQIPAMIELLDKHDMLAHDDIVSFFEVVKTGDISKEELISGSKNPAGFVEWMNTYT